MQIVSLWIRPCGGEGGVGFGGEEQDGESRPAMGPEVLSGPSHGGSIKGLGFPSPLVCENQPQARHWPVFMGTQAPGISYSLRRSSRDPGKRLALRKSHPIGEPGLPLGTGKMVEKHQVGPGLSVHLGWDGETRDEVVSITDRGQGRG